MGEGGLVWFRMGNCSHHTRPEFRSLLTHPTILNAFCLRPPSTSTNTLDYTSPLSANSYGLFPLADNSVKTSTAPDGSWPKLPYLHNRRPRSQAIGILHLPLPPPPPSSPGSYVSPTGCATEHTVHNNYKSTQ